MHDHFLLTVEVPSILKFRQFQPFLIAGRMVNLYHNIVKMINNLSKYQYILEVILKQRGILNCMNTCNDAGIGVKLFHIFWWIEAQFEVHSIKLSQKTTAVN